MTMDVDTGDPSSSDAQALLQLKRQLALQKKKLDKLSSELRRHEAENEALTAENAAIVDRLALAQSTNGAGDERGTPRQWWFSKPAGDAGGSLQLLVDTNSQLRMDNERLEIMVDALRNSFRSHIEECRQSQDRLKLSSLTAQTDGSSVASDEEQGGSLDSSTHSVREEALLTESLKSLHSIPEKEANAFGTSGDDWMLEGSDTEELHEIYRATRARRAVRRGAACASSGPGEGARAVSVRALSPRKSPVHCGGTNGQRSGGADEEAHASSARGGARRKTVDQCQLSERQHSGRRGGGRISKSWTADQSEDLLVEFGETPRPRRLSRLFSSLKL